MKKSASDVKEKIMKFLKQVYIITYQKITNQKKLMVHLMINALNIKVKVMKIYKSKIMRLVTLAFSCIYVTS